MGFFWGASTHGILNTLRIQKMFLIWVTEPPFGIYSGCKSAVIGQKLVMEQKLAMLQRNNTFYFSFERSVTHKAWSHHIGVHVLLVTDLSEENYKSISFFATPQFGRNKSRNEALLRPAVTRP